MRECWPREAAEWFFALATRWGKTSTGWGTKRVHTQTRKPTPTQPQGKGAQALGALGSVEGQVRVQKLDLADLASVCVCACVDLCVFARARARVCVDRGLYETIGAKGKEYTAQSQA